MSTGDGVEPTDDELIEMLGGALRDTDPPAESLMQFGRDSFALLRLETELASASLQLEDEASEGERELVGLRGPRPTRFVTFAWTAGEIEVEVGEDVTSGSVAGADSVHVVTRGAAEASLIVAVDQFGVFQFPTPPEPFRLEFVVGDVAVRTEWVTPT